MKKVFFSMSLILAFSLMSFTNASDTNHSLDKQIDIEISDITLSIESEVIFDAYDICTVTVTVTLSDGRSGSATATNNRGDCDSATELATNTARMRAFFDRPRR